MASPVTVRRISLGVAALVVLVALVVIYSSVRRMTERGAALDLAAQPFVAKGFTVVATSERGDPTKLEANVDPGCIVATSAKPAKLTLTYPAGVASGDAPIVLCLCAAGAVSITSPKAADGMVMLHSDAATLGGSRAFSYLPFKAGTSVTTTDAACTDAELDAWVDAKKAPPPAIDNEVFDNKPFLKKLGFSISATIKPEFPFAVVDIPANDCLVTIDNHPDDKVGLRIKGGGFLLGPATGNLAWCTTTATTTLVTRAGFGAEPHHGEAGTVNALVVPAATVGGFQGLREIAAGAGFGIAALGVPPTDHDWIAKQLLIASQVPESLIVLGHEPSVEDKELRLAALSVEKVGTLTPESAEGVFSFCDPPLDAAAASLCVFSGPQTWKLERPDAVTGLARAKLPFWLFGLKDVAEPAGLKLETELLTLARRLERNGFEPTTFEAVTETDNGAEVLGRANEDAVVAVSVGPVAPWVVPLSDKGVWTLDGEPGVVPIKPLERITLLPPPKTKLPPKAKRRTVVFRRHT